MGVQRRKPDLAWTWEGVGRGQDTLLNTVLYQFRYDFSHLICQHGMLVLGIVALRFIPHLSSALPYNIHRLNPTVCNS